MKKEKKNLSKSEKLVPKPVPEKNLISWSAPEYIYYEKNTQYFIVGGIFIVILIVVMIIIKEWMTAVVIIIAAIAFFIYSQKKPQTLEYVVTNKGIKIGQRFYSYSKLRSFWIVHNPSSDSIHFEPAKRFSLPVIVQLGSQKLDLVQKALENYLPEQKDREEDFVDKISRLIKF